jgi:nucleoid DNA-binding protein
MYALESLSPGQISEKKVVEFVSKHTNIPRTTVRASLDSCCQIIEHYLSLGYNVKLGDVGISYPTISFKAVDSNTKAGLSQLKKVCIRFRPNKELVETVNKAGKEMTSVYKLVDAQKGLYEEVGTKELTDDSNPNDAPSG